MLGFGFGLNLGARAGGAAWYQLDSLKADNTLPVMIADFQNDRYAANGAGVSFEDLFSFSRATTATYVDADGLIKTAAIDQKRIDYSGGEVGILLEDAGTNLAPSSNAFTGYHSDVEYNAGTSPDGTNNAVKITARDYSQYHYANIGGGGSLNGTYTLSVFLKRGTRDQVGLGFGVVNSNDVVFDLVNGTVVSETAGNVGSIEPFLDGWYRCSVTTTFDGSVYVQPHIWVALGNSNPNGNDWHVFAYGVQSEQADKATSYIPTDGGAVTRAKDVRPSIVGTDFSDFYNTPSSTLYMNAIVEGGVEYGGLAEISDGSDSNRMLVYYRAGTRVSSLIKVGGATVFNVNYPDDSVNLGEDLKIATAYTNGSGQFAASGVASGVDTSNLAFTADRMQLFSKVSGQAVFGKIKEVRYYPIRVSQAGLEGITTT